MKGKRIGSLFFSFLILTSIAGLSTCFSPIAFGDEIKKNLPERGISVSPEYTGIIAPQGDGLSIDLVATNHGKRNENINITVVSIPAGWKAWVKTYSFGITGVHLKSDKSKNLTLRVEPPEDVKPGPYTLGIKAQTEDRMLTSNSQVSITYQEKKVVKKATGIRITTSYPVLRGPTDGKFEFSLEVENKSDKDSIFNLVGMGPENWDINFKPAYEDKLISSLRLKADQSQTVAVEVKPSPWSAPGEYPLLVKIASAESKGEAQLKVILTGSYKMDAGTATGLLSLNAVRGDEANLSVLVKNTGSAPLNNLEFISLKPENWKVEFAPEKVDSLAPQDIKQVEVSITPADQALVGDYSVGLRAQTGRASKDIELRVTVQASTTWGWIGIGIIVVVFAGLIFLFIRLGRR